MLVPEIQAEVAARIELRRVPALPRRERTARGLGRDGGSTCLESPWTLTASTTPL